MSSHIGFKYLVEFPAITQLSHAMSEGDATTKPRNALPDTRVEDELLVNQVQALLIGRAEFSSVFLGAERGRFAVDAICMGAGRDGSTLQQAHGHGGRNHAGTSLQTKRSESFSVPSALTDRIPTRTGGKARGQT